jgi:hypothetical protein
VNHYFPHKAEGEPWVTCRVCGCQMKIENRRQSWRVVHYSVTGVTLGPWVESRPDCVQAFDLQIPRLPVPLSCRSLFPEPRDPRVGSPTKPSSGGSVSIASKRTP